MNEGPSSRIATVVYCSKGALTWRKVHALPWLLRENAGGPIILYSKGADNVISARLAAGQDDALALLAGAVGRRPRPRVRRAGLRLDSNVDRVNGRAPRREARARSARWR